MKKFLINSEGNVLIIIADDVIEVEIIFYLKNEKESVQFIALNEFDFQNIQTNLALV